ncbi:hypothetical protein ACCUM_1570 [Candidatus Accumulibacter phosphatis]|uniref:Uncharacterized protein n=1 Tax=Candidatus Accumulibacter phosphatis TaxID=327160 RepID=A0A5S4EIX3_9PROT|nr:hypothetical protein ACCUM_1570 [Candidatus Accumulibacter phosphatis]
MTGQLGAAFAVETQDVREHRPELGAHELEPLAENLRQMAARPF